MTEPKPTSVRPLRQIDAYPDHPTATDAAILRREEARRTAALADLPDALTDEQAEQYDREWAVWIEAMAAGTRESWEMRAFIPSSTDLLRDFGPLPGDEEEFAKRSRPYRRGILSLRRLHDKRVSRERLIQDSMALRHALREASEDLVDYKSWRDAQVAS